MERAGLAIIKTKGARESPGSAESLVRLPRECKGRWPEMRTPSGHEVRPRIEDLRGDRNDKTPEGVLRKGDSKAKPPPDMSDRHLRDEWPVQLWGRPTHIRGVAARVGNRCARTAGNRTEGGAKERAENLLTAHKWITANGVEEVLFNKPGRRGQRALLLGGRDR